MTGNDLYTSDPASHPHVCGSKSCRRPACGELWECTGSCLLCAVTIVHTNQLQKPPDWGTGCITGRSPSLRTETRRRLTWLEILFMSTCSSWKWVGEVQRKRTPNSLDIHVMHTRMLKWKKSLTNRVGGGLVTQTQTQTKTIACFITEEGGQARRQTSTECLSV